MQTFRERNLMAAGVTFWQFPDEENAFIDFLETTGNVVAVCDELRDKKIEFDPYPLRDVITRLDPSQLLITSDDFVDCIYPGPVEFLGEQKLVVSTYDSYVMRYRRGKFRGPGQLGQFNLSVMWKYLGDDGKEYIEKDPRFKKWGESVLRWLRKQLPDWHQFKGYRVSRRVKQALLNNEIEIVP